MSKRRSSRDRRFPRFARASFDDQVAMGCLGSGPVPELPPLDGTESGVWPAEPTLARAPADIGPGRSSLAWRLVVAAICIGALVWVGAAVAGALAR